jgi:hypothetical protein
MKLVSFGLSAVSGQNCYNYIPADLHILPAVIVNILNCTRFPGKKLER